MKFSAVLILLVAIFAVVSAIPYRDNIRLPRPRPGNPGFPNFPGQGPFNPKIPSGPWGRNRRSPDAEIELEQPIYGEEAYP